MSILNNLKFKYINIIVGSLILPSLLFPIKYSSLILIIASLATLNNLFFRNKKKILFKKLLLPFCVYYLSIILCFIVDLFYGQFSVSYLARNLSFLIIPLFVFSSNFSKKQILKLFELTSVVITIIGVIFILIWSFGYLEFNNKQEFLKQDWFKNEVIIEESYSKNTIINATINSSAQSPSLRKVVMFKDIKLGDSLVRQIIIKSKHSNKNTWLLLRNVDGDCKAWFNVANGAIGFVEGVAKVKSEKQSKGFYKFTFTNAIKSNATRDWFYISFVSDNGSYKWSNNLQNKAHFELKPPKLFLESGESLLQKQSILNYTLTSFSSLKNYAHPTYFSLVFSFVLIVLLFNNSLNVIIRIKSIFIAFFIIITLASKAVTISISLILLVYCVINYSNFKFILVFLAIGFFISFNGHLKERFLDMYQTIENFGTGNDMGDLKTLSTNNRFYIYNTYLELIKNKPMFGYGYKNGEEVIESKLNKNFNAHNQFLQSLYHSGILGFLIFILFLISPFLLNKKRNNKVYTLEFLIILVTFNFLFESLLFRQWGIILVSFIYAIYFQFFKSDLRWFR